MKNLTIFLLSLIILYNAPLSEDLRYLNESSLLRTPEVNFWGFELGNINEVRMDYRIIDTDEEFIHIDGTTDWAKSRKIDIVSRLSYDKYYIIAENPRLYGILHRVNGGAAFLYNFGNIYRIYLGGDGFVKGDASTLGDDRTTAFSGRILSSIDISTLRVVAGAELERDYGIKDYRDFYFEASDNYYVLPVAYVNWAVIEGLVINIGLPYNSIRLKPYTWLDVGGVYDFRNDYIEGAVKLRPFENRIFCVARYFSEGEDNIKLNRDYLADNPQINGGAFVSQRYILYSFEVGYNLPVLAADVALAGCGGYFKSEDVVFNDLKGGETARAVGDKGVFGGLSVTTDF